MLRARSISTSDGFTLVEVALCLSLGLLVSTTALQVWLGTQRFVDSTMVGAVERMQARVAVARFERDVRLSRVTEGGGVGPLVEAAENRLILVTPSPFTDGLEVVAWELAGGRLMRRSGPVSEHAEGERSSYSFIDHKTMVENVRGGRFTFLAAGTIMESISVGALRRVSGVRLELSMDGASRLVPVAEASVGL